MTLAGGHRSVWRALRRPSVIVGLAMIGVLLACTVGAEVIAPYDPQQVHGADQLRPPAWSDGGSGEFLLGTDQLGRDVLSRLIYGARTSLVVAGSAVVLAALFGLLVGAVSGYFGRRTDAILMRLVDVQLAFPFILLALAILSVSESRTLSTVIVVLAVTDWVVHARIVRARVLAERERDYVKAARAIGASHRRTIVRYVIPNVISTVVVVALLEFGTLMLVESVLAFAGLGISPPAVSWGTVMADGRENIATAWWLLAFPGAAIFVAVLSVNLVADGLADVLDPRLKLTGTHRKRVKPTTQPAASHDEASVPPEGSVPRDRALANDGDGVLDVVDLKVQFPAPDGQAITAVDHVTFSLGRGERLGIVGESGSGKSVTALALLGLVPQPGEITSGSIWLGDRDVTAMSDRELRAMRGASIAMVFQDPTSALNPTLRVGYQLTETVRLHRDLSRKQAREVAREALRLASVPDSRRVMSSYPFELSGGTQQRVVIAMSLCCRPSVLVADEPTTALDVTTQAAILKELDSLTQRLDTGLILISHDLAVIAQHTDRVLVMYHGEVVESGETSAVVHAPQHPYTRALLDAVEMVDASEGGGAPVGPAGSQAGSKAVCDVRSE